MIDKTKILTDKKVRQLLSKLINSDITYRSRTDAVLASHAAQDELIEELRRLLKELCIGEVTDTSANIIEYYCCVCDGDFWKAGKKEKHKPGCKYKAVE